MMFRSLCALLVLTCGAEVCAAPAKPLVFCADAGPDGFDPSLWDSASTSDVTRQIFQGLVGFVPGGTALEPQLATASGRGSRWRIRRCTSRSGAT